MAEQKFFTSKDAAILINTYGFALFPVHGFVNGCCTCGHRNCDSPGKHPASTNEYKDGLKSATKDMEALGKLWAGRKNLNVGVATGAPSGIFVIDIDSEEGESALAELGDIPVTLTVKTGKGRHLYFKYPDEKVITKKGVLYKVDVRGDGGYVCGVGTNHYSGAVYEWVNPLEEIAQAPQFILDLVLDRLQPKHVPIPLTVKKNPFSIYENDGWTKEKAYDLLSYIDADCGYDDWIHIGMGIHSEGLPFEVWDNWSKSGSKYVSHSMASHWKSFKQGAGRTFGTVVKMAQNAGWKPATKSDFKRDYDFTAPKREEDFDQETGEIKEEKPSDWEDVKPKQEDKKKGLYYIKAKDIKRNLVAADFVQGLLGDKQLSVIYGRSNTGKTFFATDLAFHVALGEKWRERRVEQGGVLYAALEGTTGINNRIVAFRDNLMIMNKDMPFVVMPCQVDFLRPDGNIDEFISLIDQAKAEIGSIRLVVIDTLARALMGGDENSGQDMGMLVYHADKIRAITGAHVCFVHHSGKDEAKGARGHSSLRAAVDTEIEVSRNDGDQFSTVKIVKQRDMEMGDDLYFGLKSVNLGQNQYGEDVFSCVVENLDEPVKKERTITLNPVQTFIYDALVEAMDRDGKDRGIYAGQPQIKCVSYDDLRLVMEERGFKEMMATEKKTSAEQVKSATQTARLALKKARKINFDRGFIWPIYEDENDGK